jgi:hypothetical protein
MAKVSSEHAEQVGFINWIRYKYPNVLCFAIPNGGFRSIRTAKLLKEEGVVPGVPDLFIPEWKVFIEMKRTKGGVVSKEQKAMIKYLNEIGYTAFVANGATEASKKVLDFLKEKQ